MPCPHKFAKYLYLEHLRFVPHTLIVGTFNPSWSENNYAEWFYGRTENNYFWEVLPRLYEHTSLLDQTPTAWKTFCTEHQIAITDLISNILDADNERIEHLKWIQSYRDDDLANYFFDFELVNVVGLLRKFPTIRQVYFTRNWNDPFWKHKLYPIKRYCEANQIRLQALLTPSGFAYWQQGKHNKQNPSEKLNLPDYILKRWQEVWHQIS